MMTYNVGDRVEIKYCSKPLSHTEFPEEVPNPITGVIGMVVRSQYNSKKPIYLLQNINSTAEELSLISRKQIRRNGV